MCIYNGEIAKCPFLAFLVIQAPYISCRKNPLEFNF